MTTKTFFVYEMPPIDDWTGWTTVHAVVERLAHREPMRDVDPTFGPDFDREWPMPAVVRFVEQFERIYALIPAGPADMRFGSEAFVAPLPDEGNCDWMFGFKLDNNGTTYIVSPHRLPWLGGSLGIVEKVEVFWR